MPLVLLLLALTLRFPSILDDRSIDQVFSKYELTGTIVVSSIESNQSLIHNKTRAATPYSPASTFKIFNSLIALEENLANNNDELFVAGGAEIYRQMLTLADRLYLTYIHANFKGDVRFPDFDVSDWKLVSTEDHEPDQNNDYAYSFIVYDRKTYSTV